MVDISTGQAGAVALRRRYKRKPSRPIDREKFREMRLIQGLSIEGTAQLLGVTPRTVMHWESGVNRIPYAPFKLLRILAWYELPSAPWKGWRIVGDTLYSPANRGFKPYELLYLSNYLTMARYWQADYARRSEQRQAVASMAESDYAGLRLVVNRREP
jgi:DNA-binding transcriptional regulator YiaG